LKGKKNPWLLSKIACEKIIQVIVVYNLSKLAYATKLNHYHGGPKEKKGLNATYIKFSRQLACK
jgi:hypothetical protein